MKTTITVALLVLAGIAAGCGGESSFTSGPSVEGTYVLDVDRTPAVAATAGGGDSSRQQDEARRARLLAKFGPEAYRMDIRPDGTFRTTLTEPQGSFVLSGTWSRTPEGLRLLTTAVNGEAPSEDSKTVQTLGVEPGALVSTEDQRTVYFKKL